MKEYAPLLMKSKTHPGWASDMKYLKPQPYVQFTATKRMPGSIRRSSSLACLGRLVIWAGHEKSTDLQRVA
jgi:hypothetical protein